MVFRSQPSYLKRGSVDVTYASQAGFKHRCKADKIQGNDASEVAVRLCATDTRATTEAAARRAARSASSAGSTEIGDPQVPKPTRSCDWERTAVISNS